MNTLPSSAEGLPGPEQATAEEAAAFVVAAAAAPHSQPLELPWLREQICAHWGDGTYPQVLLRLGTVVQTTG